MAHDYGVLWMENLGGGNWRKHIIDDTWSQAYAMTMVDLNRDGKPDFIGAEKGAHDLQHPGVHRTADSMPPFYASLSDIARRK